MVSTRRFGLVKSDSFLRLMGAGSCLPACPKRMTHCGETRSNAMPELDRHDRPAAANSRSFCAAPETLVDAALAHAARAMGLFVLL